MWLYDHGGITISGGTRTGCYADRWDSGQVGWCVIDKQTVLSELSATEENWRQAAQEVMSQEIEVYDQYLRCEVYGYELYEWDAEEQDWGDSTDSCYGFYGDDIMENGIADSIPGLMAALNAGNYEEGTAKKVMRVTYELGA